MPEATETAASTDAASTDGAGSTPLPVVTAGTAEQTGAVQFLPPAAPTVAAPATATLIYDGKEIELKVVPATEG